MDPMGKLLDSWVWWDNFLTDSELDILQNACKNVKDQGQVGNSNDEGSISEDIRRCKVGWLECDPDSIWLFKKISKIVSNLNSRYYGFELTGIAEPMQLTHYEYDNSGTYGWHQDYNSTINRKMSAVLQLSDPLDYEGGDLQLFLSKDPITVPKKRGMLAVFPSYTVHQVTPVISGTRQTIVTWFTGPDFK